MNQPDYETRREAVTPSRPTRPFVWRRRHVITVVVVAEFLLLIILAAISQYLAIASFVVLVVADAALIVAWATGYGRVLVSSSAILLLVLAIWTTVYGFSEGRPDSPILWGMLAVNYALFALWLIPRFRRSSYVAWPLVVLTLGSLLFSSDSLAGTYAGWAVIGLSVVLGILWLASFGVRPRPYAVWTILVAILALWGVTEAAARVTDTESETLLRFGAQQGGRIASGEYWRLFTTVFLHSGFSHLVGNSVIILICGHLIERFYGRVQFLSVFLIAGVAGSLTAHIYAVDGWSLVSGGASGALMGLAGALTVFFILNPGRLWEMDPRSRAIALVLILISVMAFGYESWAIIAGDAGTLSSYAHVGGFAAGLMLALLPRGQTAGRTSPRETGWVAYGAFVVRRWWLLPVAAVLLGAGLIVASDRTPMAYVERAEEHLERGDLDLAQAEVQKALDKDPEHGPAYLVNARILLARGDLDGALQSVAPDMPGIDQAEAARLLAEITCRKGGPLAPDAKTCAPYLE